MARRVIAFVAATVLAILSLPVISAWAAPLGSANLTTGQLVLPGNNAFSINVSNSDTTIALLGGKSINAVRFILPSSSGVYNDTSTPVVAGWNVEKTNDGGTQIIDFAAAAPANAIGPTASKPFPFTADVRAPLSGDRTGTFDVGLSTNGGETFETATGNLDTSIRVLQVTANSVTGPTLAADSNGTGGQEVTFTVNVKNLARSALNVTPKLTSTGSDTISDATAASVPAGGETSYTVPVTLGGSGATSDRAATFTGSATAPSAATTGFLNKDFGYTVQAPVRLVLQGSTFAPKDVRAGLDYDPSLDVEKLATQTAQLTAGSITFTNGATSTIPASLKAPVDYAGGTSTQKLSFNSFRFEPGSPDGNYNANFVFTAVDGNGFTKTLSPSLANALTLDSLAPTVAVDSILPMDRDNAQTTRVRSGSLIKVEGTHNDVRATMGAVGIEVVETGERILATNVTTTNAGGIVTFKGSVTPALPLTGTIRAIASAQDPAGNIGADDGSIVEIDNVKPTLVDATGSVIKDARYDVAKAVIGVQFVENFALMGGCDPISYEVDGQNLVQSVKYSNGNACVKGQAGPTDNVRILILTSDIKRGDTSPQPAVTYDPERNPVAGDDAKDAAGAYNLEETQDTVQKLVPDAPSLVSVTRNGGAETAYKSGENYYTRFGGSDLRVTVSGGLAGDTLQLLRNDTTGTVVSSVAVIDNNGQAGINVPLASVDNAVQSFKLRFLSPAGVEGNETPFNAVLDRIVPTVASTARVVGSTANEVDVNFSEELLGSNNAGSWTVYELVDGEEPGTTDEKTRLVNEVTGSGNARRLKTAMSPTATYGGAKYLHSLSRGQRYEDFAGNQIASPTKAVA